MGEENKEGFKQLFKVKISTSVRDRIFWFTQNYDKEISGWLTGEIKDGEIIIDEILFPEQEVSATSVDTTGGNLVKLRKEYGDKCKRIIGHWHSHNTMSAFWSSTDEDFIKEHTEGRIYRIFLVSSTTDGIRARIEINEPIRLSIDELEINYDIPELDGELNKILKEKIIERKFVYKEGYSKYWWDNQKEFSDSWKREDISFGRVSITKGDWNVKLSDTTQDFCERYQGAFGYEEEVTLLPNGRLDIIYKTNGKMKARQLRDEIKETLSIIEARAKTVLKNKKTLDKDLEYDVIDMERYEDWENEMVEKAQGRYYDMYGNGRNY